MKTKIEQDHLFINYASEDIVLAKWLTMKLTNEGYAVWCDQVKLLGGESYPRDIDEAIKNRTFRLIALLSNHSIHKDNPRKERTLALSIGRERKIDFIIPLNVDGLSATDLDWMTSDITYIPFHRGWADGLSRLLKKLDSIEAPKILSNGKEITSSTYLHHETLKKAPERIFTNGLEFVEIPESIYILKFKQGLSPQETKVLSDRWAFFQRNPEEVFSFFLPPESDLFPYTVKERVRWREWDSFYGIPTYNIMIHLLRRTLEVLSLQIGLWRSEKGRLYIPFGLFENDKIFFQGYTGKKTWVLVAGERHSPFEYKYHLSPSFWIKERDGKYLALVEINLHLTDTHGVILDSKLMTSRHKSIRKGWWNNHLLNRCLAICEMLSRGEANISYGSGEDRVTLNKVPISFESQWMVDESNLEGLPEDEVEDDVAIVDEDDFEGESE